MVHTVDVAAGWDDYSDDYEEESLEDVRKILRSGPSVVTEPLLSVRDVAELILERSKDLQMESSKLQVLCYLVQGHYLASTGAPAFGEGIFASSHGPFIDVLATVGSDLTGVNGRARLAEKDQLLSVVVTQIVARYGSWTAGQLRELVRNQTPWIEAQQNAKLNHGVIAPGLMRNYFAYQLSIPFDPAD